MNQSTAANLTSHPPMTARRGVRQLFRLAWLMTWRDARAGELTTLLVALTLAVAALTSVGFVADRMHQGLNRDARQMMGADLRIRADHAIEPAFQAHAASVGLRTATTAIFPSMAAAVTNAPGDAASGAVAGGDAATRLVAVKAVSEGYPLRGAVQIAAGAVSAGPASTSAESTARGIPARGTVWVDPQLLDALHLRVGDAIQLGIKRFRIAATIVREPDRGFAFINFSPRVMMRDDELAATGLIGPGSRVTYRLLLADEDATVVAEYARWSEARIGAQNLRGMNVESLTEGQPQVQATLDRADRFLRLVSLLTALLAAVAIAMTAQRFSRRHLDVCAIMRCLGASERTLRGVFIVEFVTVAVAGGIAGSVLGYVGHAVLLHWLGQLINVDLPAATLWPAVGGMGAGLVLLLGFALPPLLPLTRVPPGRVLRRDWGVESVGRWGYAVGIGAFCALLFAAAGEVKLGAIVALGFGLGVPLFGVLGWGGIKLLALASVALRARAGRTRRPFGWGYAIASLNRRSAASAVQVSALGIALMCLMLLAMTRNDLIAGWRQSTPPDAPNRFVIDIQPDQQAEIARALQAAHLSSEPLAPMVRGRLTQMNGKSVGPDQFKDARVKRLVDREFNLSYRATLPPDNQLTSGQWYGDSTTPQISIEAGLAHDIGVKVGDRLRFEVAGQSIEAPVTSVRKLDWGSFRVNFFVLMPAAALADFPATFITSFHAEPQQEEAIDSLVRAYPNLTVIDTSAILAQLQRVLDQVINAVQFLFLFTLAAGLVVLYTALAGSRDERSRESALLRALGATHRQVRASQRAEFIVVGALAGVVAAVGAQSIGWILARRVFDFTLTPNPWLVLFGVAAGLLCAVVGGWWSLRNVLRRPVLQTLRED